jgi:sn-glycerol 3-phosphate transport system substrate-binding protein
MSRRRAGLAVLSAVALVAVACSDPPTSGNGSAAGDGGDGEEAELPECPLDALDDAAGPVEIDLWYGALPGTPGETMEAMVTRFNESQDDIVLRATNQGNAYEEIFRSYESAASGSPDQLPDLVFLEDTQLGSLVDGGLVLPAQACMEADGYELTDLEPAARAAYTVDDVLYPGYMNVSTPILYYNRAHWVEAGLDPDDPPETLAEVAEQARALKEAGVSERPFAVHMSRWFFETWLSGVGSDVVDNDNGRSAPATEATLDSPEARELLGLLQDMNDEGLLNAFAYTEGSIDHYLAVAGQQSSMVVETSTAATTIRDALGGDITADEAGVGIDDSLLDGAELAPAAGPFPGLEAPGRVHASGGAFYILNTSDPAQQAASWRFLRFMLEPENAMEWHLNGSYLPIVKAAQDEEEIQTFWEEDPAGRMLRISFEQLEDADPDEPGPLIGPYPDFRAASQQAMDEVILTGRDPGPTLEAADDEVTDALERYSGTG